MYFRVVSSLFINWLKFAEGLYTRLMYLSYMIWFQVQLHKLPKSALHIDVR
jgi:hypothetical protein